MNTLQEKINIKTENKIHIKSEISALHIISIITIIMFLVYEILNIIMFNKTNAFYNMSYILSPAVLVLNLLPLVCAAFFLYCICNSIKVSTAVVSVIVSAFYIVNEYKITFRDEPLCAMDIAIAKEAVKISENYNLQPKASVITAVVLLVVFFVFAFSSFKNIKAKAKFRICGAVCSVAIMALSFLLLYQNPVVAGNVPDLKEEYYSVSIAMKKGLPNYILSGEMGSSYKKPEGYSKETAKQILGEYNEEAIAADEPVNVIAIMSEAFFDPTNAQNLDFYEDKYPLTNFQQMKKEGIYGNLNVHGFGGGTSATEFEFLSGANFYFASPTLADIYTTAITRDMYALPRVFGERGYTTSAIHPGHEWFYNRDRVYQRMGFDSLTFEEDLPADTQRVYYYVSDAVTTNLIIEDYAKHLETSPDKGYFNFTVTIQNHGPYSAAAAAEGDYFVRPEGISDELYNVVNNYMAGLRDADNMLGSLKEYVNGVDKPTVIVFFGDHLPYFDNKDDGYRAIGYNIDLDTTDGMVNKYKTPYLIWGNEAFKRRKYENGEKVMYGNYGTISANYLANAMFDYTGMPVPAYFQFTAGAKDAVSVIGSRYNVAGGEITADIPPEYDELMKNYKIVQYYSVMDYSSENE